MNNSQKPCVPSSLPNMADNPKSVNFHLVRYCFQRDRILSFLIIPDLPGSAARVLPCIENRRYTFPDGRYRLRLTHSKRFNRPMPLIDEVPATPEFPSYDGRTCGYRTGMRIHLARTPEQLHGCIGLNYDSGDGLSRDLPKGALDYHIQVANLSFINSILQIYATQLIVTSVPFDGPLDRLSHDANFITNLVCTFPQSCHSRLSDFVFTFHCYAVCQSAYDGQRSPAVDAYRKAIADLWLTYVNSVRA